jgi:hypothetical protein
VITNLQVIPLLLEVCPSFKERYDEHLKDNDGELLYVALGSFAHHLLELYQQHQTQNFFAVGRVIERLHIEGDHHVREAATIGLLEGIQNVWGNKNVKPDLFLPYLLPESIRWWQSLNNFWSGKSKFVGEEL